MKDAVKRFSQVAVLAVSGAIIARILYQDFGEVASYLARMDLFLMSAGAAVLIAGLLVGRLTWKMVMDGMGYRIDLLKALYLISMFQVASYIPGGFWQFLGIAYWTEDEGVPKKVTAVGTGINAGTGVVVALLLFFAVAPFYLPSGDLSTYLPLALAVPAGLVAIHPKVFYPVLNRGLEYLGREAIEPVLEYRQLLGVFVVNLISRSLTGAALYLFLASVTAADIALLPALVAFYAGAWAIGFLVIFMPGGLGVREVTAISFLSTVMAEPLAALVVLVYRTVAIVSEFALAAVFHLLTR